MEPSSTSPLVPPILGPEPPPTAAAPDPPLPPPPPASTLDEPDDNDGSCTTGPLDKGKSKAVPDVLERFTCHICLDVPSEPVVTPCGHLHCWPCMHEWLVESKGRACPVCKSPLKVEQLVPIYAGSGQQTDPRSKPIPPRPRPAGALGPAAPSYRATAAGGTTSATSTFALQAGLFPLPGLSFGWSWPPTPSGTTDSARAPHHPFAAHPEEEGAPFLVAQPGAAATWVRGRTEVDWRTAVLQQIFMVLFFAVFVAITLAG